MSTPNRRLSPWLIAAAFGLFGFAQPLQAEEIVAVSFTGHVTERHLYNPTQAIYDVFNTYLPANAPVVGTFLYPTNLVDQISGTNLIAVYTYQQAPQPISTPYGFNIQFGSAPPIKTDYSSCSPGGSNCFRIDISNDLPFIGFNIQTDSLGFSSNLVTSNPLIPTGINNASASFSIVDTTFPTTLLSSDQLPRTSADVNFAERNPPQGIATSGFFEVGSQVPGIGYTVGFSIDDFSISSITPTKTLYIDFDRTVVDVPWALSHCGDLINLCDQLVLKPAFEAEHLEDRIVQTVREMYSRVPLNIVKGTPPITSDDIYTIHVGGAPSLINNPSNSQGEAQILGHDGFVFEQLANVMTTDSNLVELYARNISHEAGHLFGLEHLALTAANEHIMEIGAISPGGHPYVPNNGGDYYFEATPVRTAQPTIPTTQNSLFQLAATLGTLPGVDYGERGTNYYDPRSYIIEFAGKIFNTIGIYDALLMIFDEDEMESDIAPYTVSIGTIEAGGLFDVALLEALRGLDKYVLVGSSVPGGPVDIVGLLADDHTDWSVLRGSDLAQYGIPLHNVEPNDGILLLIKDGVTSNIGEIALVLREDVPEPPTGWILFSAIGMILLVLHKYKNDRKYENVDENSIGCGGGKRFVFRAWIASLLV